MANADFDRAWKRVNDVLNASAPGTFSTSLSSRNKTRTADAIEAAGFESGLEILRAIAEVPNEFRSALTTTSTVTHGQALPAHIGKPTDVEIQRYSNAAWREGKQKSYEKIEAYRANENNIYGSLAHSVAGSPLSGYYDIHNNQIYFTGYACRAGLVQFDRDDVTDKIPDVFESTWIKLWLGLCPKAGEGAYSLAICERYGNEGKRDLVDFQNGKRTFGEVSAPTPESAKAP